VKSVYYHPEADAEVTEAARYYESRSPGLGLIFLSEIQRAVSQVVTNPEAYPKIANDIRRKALRRFPYGLMYAIEPDRIRIVAVAHSKRRPYYWSSRIG
jgi:plasmid stabilization system protein ParE